jgi:hypothetical protein
MSKVSKPEGWPRTRMGVAVRLADGTRLYLCAAGEGRRGQQDWGRQSQARRFDTKEEAQQVADVFETNSAAKEYEVVRLPQ